MKLDRVYTRFFRSFNYDYERKARSGTPRSWEQTPLGWYPFVRLDVDPKITAVVGANESGKSHMLDAIEALMTGSQAARRDFCRYADLYSVEQGERRLPDFGGRFVPELEPDGESVSPADTTLMERLGYPASGSNPLYYIRSGAPNQRPIVFTQHQPAPRSLDSEQEQALRESFPTVFRLKTEVALPASMSIGRLAGESEQSTSSRLRRRALIDAIDRATTSDTNIIMAAVSEWRNPAPIDPHVAEAREQEYQLGRSLLINVARIDPQSFSDLDEALKGEGEREGEVNALIQRMNDAIAKHLNFPKWWAQDRNFRLQLSPREREVVFTIRDRTETEYSFAERSRGLKYFLSYYVQLRAHAAPVGRRQLLLLDEPDAYLSGVGQQDLLRILEEFANPEDGSQGGQVVYVTHSPYLINRNAASRIRVLDKGTHDEGTRVVTDASRNHYEPLRSSLGPFVAETAFIGGANLFVEGAADQVLLAGVSAILRFDKSAPSETLNLNDVTIVPAGSASEIPYMVYLARGRDHVKPPAVVLLDGDAAGKAALRRLRRNPAGRARYIDDRFIVNVDEWATEAEVDVDDGIVVEEPEDLIDVRIAAAAGRRYAQGLLGLTEDAAAVLTADQVAEHVTASKPHLWDALTAAFIASYPDEHIEKVGFAREVVGLLRTPGDSLVDAAAKTTRRFASLLARLAERLHDAYLAEEDAQQRDRVSRLVRGFLRDHDAGATRDLARILFREIDRALEDTEEGDRRRNRLAEMRRSYELAAEPTEQVPNYDTFKEDLRALQYQDRLAHQPLVVDDEPVQSDAAACDESTAVDAPGAAPVEETTNVAAQPQTSKHVADTATIGTPLADASAITQVEQGALPSDASVGSAVAVTAAVPASASQPAFDANSDGSAVAGGT